MIHSCLHIGDNDLIGRKFNGYDLCHALRFQGIDARCLVQNKQSTSDFVRECSFNVQHGKELFFDRDVIAADVLHLHLIHNTKFDINYLPLLSSLKPVVWSLHDPWSLGGHCIHHGSCDAWKTHCHDCSYLESPFALSEDTSSLEFFIKKRAIQGAQIHAIVASEWMKNKVEQSPMWKGKTVHLIPFGVDEQKFYPEATASAREKLSIHTNEIVFFARTNQHFKGVQILKKALQRVAENHRCTLLTVGETGLLPELPGNITLKEYGWINDEALLETLYNACDLFLMPSEQEAFGLMAIEAMSCGKMVLALDTPSSAVPVVVHSPTCGVAVSSDKYAEELLRLLKNPHEIIERGKKSLTFARENYASLRYVKGVLDVYRNAVSEFQRLDEAALVYEQLKKQFLFPIAVTQAPLVEAPAVQRVNLLRSYYERTCSYYKRHGIKDTIFRIFKKITKG